MSESDGFFGGPTVSTTWSEHLISDSFPARLRGFYLLPFRMPEVLERARVSKLSAGVSKLQGVEKAVISAKSISEEH